MRKSGKNKLIYTVLLLACIIGFWLFENLYTPEAFPSSNPTSVSDLIPASTTGEEVVHGYYSLSYSEAHEQAEWVAYELRPGHLSRAQRKRPFFEEDPLVRFKSADWRNYRGSGFDRGHLCPAGDRRFSEQAYNETFYTSNISPQRKDFNAGIWNELEKQVRSWCRRYGDLYIVTAGVLQGSSRSIGEESVTVPAEFYKIVARKSENGIKAIAFLIPHKESSRPLSDFLVPVDSLENLTGIDFFTRIPPEIQDSFEMKISAEDWVFSEQP